MKKSSAARQIDKLLSLLDEHYPEAGTALAHTDPLELLIATILSAQCTDDRVNQVTPGLFRKFRNASDYAKVDQDVLEGYIRSTGFFRNKAKNIISCCRALIEKHGGRVPETLEELVALPGVGRKTANCVLGMAFGKPGMVVDTHVKRISNRLGLTDKKDPDKIELDLMKVIPRDSWTSFSNQLIHFGRAVCNARKPKCGECFLLFMCDFGRKEVHRP